MVGLSQQLRWSGECIKLIRRILTGEQVDYAGDLFDISGFTIDMTDYHECPIYLAPLGERNRQHTGEFANGQDPLLIPGPKLDTALELI